jgi:hypothetical protein
MEDVGIFCGPLVHLTVFCYILWTLGIFCGHFGVFLSFWYIVQEKSGNPGAVSEKSFNKACPCGSVSGRVREKIAQNVAKTFFAKTNT